MSKAYSVIKTVLVTEKATEQMEEGKYVFKVAAKSNKVEIAKAIEELFNVKVDSVNTMNYNGKRKRRRGIMGKKADFKKAVVTLVAGNTIEIY